MSEPKPKSFEISKRAVWEAYRRVKANKGAAGVDEQSIDGVRGEPSGEPLQALESAVVGELFPAAGAGGGDTEAGRQLEDARGADGRGQDRADRRARVPGALGGAGVPPGLLWVSAGPVGAGRGRGSAGSAAGERTGCSIWTSSRSFDSVPWDLVLKAVAHHTDQRWVLLYVERWLKAPLQLEDGSLVERDRGTPQGSAISPLLANMFLHYAFDAWMAREYPAVQFERYCDDMIVHARSERQARSCGRRSPSGWRSAGLSSTSARPASCTARTTTGAAHTSTRRSTSWATRSARGCRRASSGSTS